MNNTQAFLLLMVAIASEIVGSTALKYSEGFSKWLPVLVIIVGYGVAFYLLSLSIRTIPLSTAYAIWSGVGTAGTALVGVLLFREGVSLPKILGIILIIVGVIVLNAFNKGTA